LTQLYAPDNYAPTFQTGPPRSVSYEAKVEAIANHLDRTCRSRILLPAGCWPIVCAASAGDESAVHDSGLRPLLPAHNLSARRATTDVRTFAVHGTTHVRACSNVRASTDVSTGNHVPTTGLCTSPTASALPGDLHPATNLWSADDNASSNDYRASRGLHGTACSLRIATNGCPRSRSASDGPIRLQFDTLSVWSCSSSRSSNTRTRGRQSLRAIGLQPCRPLHALPDQSTRPECDGRASFRAGCLVAKHRPRLARVGLDSLATGKHAGLYPTHSLPTKLDYGRRRSC